MAKMKISVDNVHIIYVRKNNNKIILKIKSVEETTFDFNYLLFLFLSIQESISKSRVETCILFNYAYCLFGMAITSISLY